jgi:hypothetical protein
MRARPILRPRRLVAVALAATTVVMAAAGPVLACAGLVTPSGNVRLLRTSTLAAWANGYEHYVTSFTFDGGGAEVGSIVPLPAVPEKVERGGDWTLQRLERETQPPSAAAAPKSASSAESDRAEVVYETKIDALDITILKGGGQAVFDWAREHGFSLTPDAPEVLDFYAQRSPVFMAARFDTNRAEERNQQNGEGTPIHLTMPVDEPWVPLRILGLGRQAEDSISADVYLLTPDRPELLPAPSGGRFDPRTGEPVRSGGPGDGLVERHSAWASKSLLDDLRSDKGMEWVPAEMWLTYLLLSDTAGRLRYDLATETEGNEPSRVEAGLEAPPATTTTAAPTSTTAAPAPPTTARQTTAKAVKPGPGAAKLPVTPPTTAVPLPVEPPPAPIRVEPQAPPALAEEPVLAHAGEEVAARPVSSRRSGGGFPTALVAALGGAGLGGLLAAGARRLQRRPVS